MKVLIAVLITIILVLLTVFSIRFIFGGLKDDWICVNGQWMSHGNPSSGQPWAECKKTNDKIKISDSGQILDK